MISLDWNMLLSFVKKSYALSVVIILMHISNYVLTMMKKYKLNERTSVSFGIRKFMYSKSSQWSEKNLTL